eukprot:TRINITY_DN8402_c0_g1_i2.p1 TRINITY_DN8402_c0_g1~~TRINITY_DN8402_c0_g1_i2.p1  ORF type:complete len:159 (+),score=38.73 TRINITY_DN8402_c0_g1_i2:84-560(+)
MQQVEYKLAVVGDGAVGKSAVTIQFIGSHFVECYDPTIEDSYRKQEEIDGNVCILDILDTAGQEEYCCMRDVYMRTGRGFILIYDITSKVSFEGIQKLVEQILKTKDKDSVPMVLLGNKCDLEEKRVVFIEEGQALSHKVNCTIVESSTKPRINRQES